MTGVAETIYTVMLTSTSYVVSAGAVHALRRAAASGRTAIRVVPIGSCAHCRTPHRAVEITLSDVRAIVRHDTSGAFAALSTTEKIVPLRRFAAG